VFGVPSFGILIFRSGSAGDDKSLTMLYIKGKMGQSETHLLSIPRDNIDLISLDISLKPAVFQWTRTLHEGELP
jgi:hypothetical protein